MTMNATYAPPGIFEQTTVGQLSPYSAPSTALGLGGLQPLRTIDLLRDLTAALPQVDPWPWGWVLASPAGDAPGEEALSPEARLMLAEGVADARAGRIVPLSMDDLAAADED